VLDCAKGAALMSGTTYDVEFLTGCYELLPNDVISRIMLDKMDALGPVAFSADEMAFARELQRSLSEATIAAARRDVLEAAAAGTTADDIGDVLCTRVIRPSEAFRIMHGSTEVGDVSQIAPTANLLTCCHPSARPATAGRSRPRRAPASASAAWTTRPRRWR
jgi:aminobenzoyl-glutamate utilization protein B